MDRVIEQPVFAAAMDMLGEVACLQTMLREAAHGGLAMPDAIVHTPGVSVVLAFGDIGILDQWVTFLGATTPLPTSTGARFWATCVDAFGLHVQIVSGG